MVTSSPPTDVSNADLVRWNFEAINRRDASMLKQLWTAETVVRFPDRTCTGADEIAAYFEEVFAAMPDWHMEAVRIAAQDDDVFVRWHLTGTHSGPLLGIEPTGKALAVDGMDHFVVRQGKIVSNFVIFDQMQYARQIGMMPPDGSSADKAVKGAFNLRTKLSQRLARRRQER
jgi:steroid delta-isomerase-like uncharacterized protein